MKELPATIGRTSADCTVNDLPFDKVLGCSASRDRAGTSKASSLPQLTLQTRIPQDALVARIAAGASRGSAKQIREDVCLQPPVFSPEGSECAERPA